MPEALTDSRIEAKVLRVSRAICADFQATRKVNRVLLCVSRGASTMAADAYSGTQVIEVATRFAAQIKHFTRGVDCGNLTKLPDRQPTLRVWRAYRLAVTPGIDSAAGSRAQWICGQYSAVHRARGRVATWRVNSFQFKQPLFMGRCVSFTRASKKVGRHSIRWIFEVFAQRVLPILFVCESPEAN